MTITKEQCLDAISEAFGGATVTVSCGSWIFLVESKDSESCLITLMPKFVQQHINSGDMTAKDLTELLKNTPSAEWDRSNGKAPMLVLGDQFIDAELTTNKPEPCPKCGEADRLVPELHIGTSFIRCDACEHIGPERRPMSSPEAVWRAWNSHAKTYK